MERSRDRLLHSQQTKIKIWVRADSNDNARQASEWHDDLERKQWKNVSQVRMTSTRGRIDEGGRANTHVAKNRDAQFWQQQSISRS